MYVPHICIVVANVKYLMAMIIKGQVIRELGIYFKGTWGNYVKVQVILYC